MRMYIYISLHTYLYIHTHTHQKLYIQLGFPGDIYLVAVLLKQIYGPSIEIVLDRSSCAYQPQICGP